MYSVTSARTIPLLAMQRLPQAGERRRLGHASAGPAPTNPAARISERSVSPREPGQRPTGSTTVDAHNAGPANTTTRAARGW